MSDPAAHEDQPRRHRSTERVVVDCRLVARAVEINDAIAAEFTALTFDPYDNPAVRRLEELGFETETIVHQVAGRAKQIFFCMRHGRGPRSADEVDQDFRELTDAERDELVALSVAWWDGMLAGLRARRIACGTRAPQPSTGQGTDPSSGR